MNNSKLMNVSSDRVVGSTQAVPRFRAARWLHSFSTSLTETPQEWFTIDAAAMWPSLQPFAAELELAAPLAAGEAPLAMGAEVIFVRPCIFLY